MNRFKTLMIATTFLAAAPATSFAADALSTAQKNEVEQVVREYLLNNPEIIAEAIGELQRRDKMAEAEQRVQALQTLKPELTSNPNDPVMGNPNGDVTVVEFFDYRCGFCKRAFNTVQQLLKEDGNIRYVLKEFPILGEESVIASRASMAVWLHQPNRYAAFHTAMMTTRGNLDSTKVLALAEESGVDLSALSNQMDDAAIMETFKATRAQAQALGLSGTPAFIIGDGIAPGAVPLAALKEMVAAARKN